MVIIWRGLGFLVPVIGIAMLLLSRWGFDVLFGKGYFREHDWPAYAAVGLASVAIGLFGYLLNYRMRKVVHDPQTGEVVGKSPSHALFFVPVQYWALVLPAILIWGQLGAAEREQNETSYLQSPQVQDVYITDLSLLLEDIETRNKWGVMKVVRVGADEVDVKIGSMGYGVPAFAKKALRDGEDLAPDYYVEDSLTLKRSELPTLKETRVISDVVRRSLEDSVAQATLQ
jgi:hypothetical protein